MSERRYDEEEVAQIFELAAEKERTATRRVAPSEGMTLATLQEIGLEVGISPELVAQAARSLDRSGRASSRRFLGLPLGVGRTVELGRTFSDEEWERLVVDLRETFDARGSVRRDGSLRQWTNGNLQALVEPTSTGDRVRLRTLNGSARGFMTAGGSILGVAVVMLIGLGVGGRLGDPGSLADIAFMSTMGLAMFGVGALRLPRWARERRRQMEELAGRLTLSLATTELETESQD